MDSNNNTSLRTKFIACMVLHALGDTIGYKNAEWEFKQGTTVTTRVLEKMYEFIELGGINFVPQKGWLVSDDTIMHVKTGKALLEKYSSLNTLGEHLKKHYIDAYNQFKKEGQKKREPGKATMIYLNKLASGAKWHETQYDEYAGGSGASMRTSCIGLAFFGENNRDMLIQVAIESSRITHNNAIGYLGGLTSALFTAFALEGKRINDWPFLLMELFENGSIFSYIKSSGRELKKFDQDQHAFIDKWKRYIEDKFDEKRNAIYRRANKNLIHRTSYYATFKFEKATTFFPGSGGDDSVIVAYDCLIDAGKSWEKLVVYGMLHGGDTDTTGCIAASWWGAVKGFENVPLEVLQFLEMRKEIEQLGIQLFERYHSLV